MVECPNLNGPNPPILRYVPLVLINANVQTSASALSTKGHSNLSLRCAQVQFLELHGANESPLQLWRVTSLAVQSEQLATLLLFMLNALNGDPPHPPQRFSKLNLICFTNIGACPMATGLTNGTQTPDPNPYPRHLTYPRTPPTLLRPSASHPSQLALLNREKGGATRVDNENLEFRCGQTGPLTESWDKARPRSRPPYPLPAIGKHR